MRIAPLLTALLLLPVHASAGDITLEFLNSELTFGNTAFDVGWDGAIFDLDVWDVGFVASPDRLVTRTLVRDRAGAVIQTNYVYEGGTFEVAASGGRTFALPIVTFQVFAPEPGRNLVRSGPGFGGDVYFELGPALLEAALARDLGLGRRILGGRGSTDLGYGFQMAIPDYCGGELGDHLSAVRHACDGATYVDLRVSEPAGLALFSVGAVALAWHIRRRRG